MIPPAQIPNVEFMPFRAEHAIELDLQPSQWFEAGLTTRTISIEDARELQAAGDAWTALDLNGRLLACFGTAETFPGKCGVAWAMIAKDVPERQLALIARFVRARMMESPLGRIEAIVADEPRCRTWAKHCGLTIAHVMRKWGAAGTDHLLCERIS